MAAHDPRDELPLDSDLEVDDSPSGPVRPVHLRCSYLGLVALGGALGTAIREGVAITLPGSVAGFPATIFVINIGGAFLLGFLLEFLARRGADEGRRRTLRLLLGTGVLGGFTTYSSFATGTASLTGTTLGVAIGYAAATLFVGFIASTAGIGTGSLLHKIRSRSEAA